MNFGRLTCYPKVFVVTAGVAGKRQDNTLLAGYTPPQIIIHF